MYSSKLELSYLKLLFKRRNLNNAIQVWAVGACTLSQQNLKGVFAKNKRVYRLSVKNKLFRSLLILLLSVVSIRRKLLKTTYTEERSVHPNSENCNINLGSQKKSNKQSIQILQPITNNH